MSNGRFSRGIMLGNAKLLTYTEKSPQLVEIAMDARKFVNIHSTTTDERDFASKLLKLCKMVSDARNAVLYLMTGRGVAPTLYRDRQWLQDHEGLHGTVDEDAYSSATCAWTAYYDGPFVTLDLRIADCSKTIRLHLHQMSARAAAEANKYLMPEDQYEVTDGEADISDMLSTLAAQLHSTAGGVLIRHRATQAELRRTQSTV